MQVHTNDTSIEIFVTCLCVHERLMTSRMHACAIAHAWHEFKNIRHVLSCARKINYACMYELPVPSSNNHDEGSKVHSMHVTHKRDTCARECI